MHDPYHVNGWNSSPPPTIHSILLGIEHRLGGLQQGQLITRETMKDRFDRLEDRVSNLEKAPPDEPPQKPPGSLGDNLKLVKEIIQFLIPLTLLVAVVVGKMTLLEGIPLLRKAIALN